MSVIDFSRSYMTFFAPHDSPTQNNARISIEAACTVTGPDGASDAFYLVAPCRAEHMYRDTPMFVMPSYEFKGIWSESEFVIIRRHWLSNPDYLDSKELEGTGGPVLKQYGRMADKFDRCELSIRRVDAEKLKTSKAVSDATFGDRSLVARTVLKDEASSTTATLEYPVATMNAKREPAMFQVDAGPVLVPDFGSKEEHQIERLEQAFVVYNNFDKAEFILLKPVQIEEGTKGPIHVTDYSEVVVLPAANEIWAVNPL